MISIDGAHRNSVAMTDVLHQTLELLTKDRDSHELLIRGNLYRLCSYFIDAIKAEDDNITVENKELTKVANIEAALEMIHFSYAEPLTLDDAARVTGYEKSNFCKIFKSIMGNTFHVLLNRQRAQVAGELLIATDLSVSQIAQNVGFSEIKTFSRVFKEITGMTPCEYRKERRDRVGS